MAQINITEVRNGSVFKEAGQLLLVISYEHVKMGRGSGVVKLKVKNLKTGATTERGFITGARVEAADVEKRPVQFLYKDTEAYNFMDPKTYEQFTISTQILGETAKYLKENLDCLLIVSGEEALSVDLPLSIIYTIKETGPEEKGNSVSNVYKEAVLDNDLIVKVPMFMHAGEKVKVDTKTGQYVERVK